MDISKIALGKNAPDQVNVIIENPMGGDPVKYEMDKDSGAVFVDRIMHTAMFYPANYGFIPHTLGGDGDPVDCLVLGQYPIVPGAVMPSRPVGVLMMEDDGGMDEKILCVPDDKMHPLYKNVKEHTDLEPIILEQIQHFFERYKDLEKGKWVKLNGWQGADKAKELIQEGIDREAGKEAA